MANAVTREGSSGPAEAAGRKPAVSIIVPCFDGGRFLDNMMSSLDRQTFRDFEIIIVDDGSTDPATVRKLSLLADRALILRQQNRGPASARNFGIRAAHSDIVFMLDCDDTIEPTFLAETVLALRAAGPKAGMAFTHIRFVGGETGVARRYFNHFDLLFTNTMSSGLVMWRQAWEAVGGYDETMRDGYEDWEFSLRLADAGYRGIEIPKPLYVYYIGGDDTHPSRSLDVDRQMLYGKLWREIRLRHKPDFRFSTMLRLWRQSRDGTGRIPLWKGLGAYVAACLLPEALFNQLIAHFHRGPRAQSATASYGTTTGQAPFPS